MRSIITAAVAAALLALPSTGQAQVAVGPTVAYHNDFDLGVGAVIQTALPQLAEGVGALADFTYFFPSADGLTYFEVNGNATWDIPLEDAPVAPFALGGLNVARVSVDSGDTDFGSFSASSTEIGLNVGGGIAFEAGSLRPLVGLKAELNGGEGVVLFGAVPFSLGN